MYKDKDKKFVRCKKCGMAGPAGTTSSPDFIGDGRPRMTCDCGERYVEVEIEHPVKHKVMKCNGCSDTVYTIEQSRAYHRALVDSIPTPTLKKRKARR